MEENPRAARNTFSLTTSNKLSNSEATIARASRMGQSCLQERSAPARRPRTNVQGLRAPRDCLPPASKGFAPRGRTSGECPGASLAPRALLVRRARPPRRAQRRGAFVRRARSMREGVCTFRARVHAACEGLGGCREAFALGAGVFSRLGPPRLHIKFLSVLPLTKPSPVASSS